MSFPPMSNYYGQSSNTMGQQRGYAPSTDVADRGNQYQSQTRNTNDSRQSQYGSHGYGWSDQSQNVAAQNTQNTYANESWQDRSSVPNTYNYQRDPYASQGQVNTSQSTFQSRDLYNSQNAQGLNHLAYASGLDSSTSSSLGVRPPQSQPTARYTSPIVAQASQLRTASPANLSGRYGMGAQQSSSSATYSTQSNDTQPSVNQNLAHDAAAALAGAMRNRHSQPSQRLSHGGDATSSSKTITGNTQTREDLNQRPPSLHKGSSPTQRSRKVMNQSRTSNTGGNVQSWSATTNNPMSALQSEQRRSSQSTRLDDNYHQKQAQIPVQQQVPVTPNPQSIANLVSNNNEIETQVHDSVENQEGMPHYIDPTQVFNPYHREYERRKKEAAEAEARQKAEERRVAEEQKKVSDDNARRAVETSTTANSKSKVTKKSNVAKQNVVAQSSSQPPVNSTDSNTGEEAMAVEMQKIMSRMKEFRTTNPALFQKLWNDMRGGNNASNTAATATAPSTTIQSPSPQILRAPLATSEDRPTSTTRPPRNKADTNTVTVGRPGNGYKVVVENNLEGLPDLGRYPAERRIRQPYGRHGKNDAQTDAQMPSHEPSAVATASEQPSTAAVHPEDPNTAWPEPRRRAVAVAAVNLLGANPENASIQVTAQEICSILERNPSYLDLCTALESKGLTFQRTTFARELLRNVPELQIPASKSSAAKQEVAAMTSAAQAITSAAKAFNSAAQAYSPPRQPAQGQQASITQVTSQPLPDLQELSHSEPSEPSVPQALPTSTDTVVFVNDHPKPSPKQSARPPRLRATASGRPEPPPGSKEAAARKRDFSELIDLTEIGDDDNYVLPTKQPRLDHHSMQEPFKQNGSNMPPSFNGNSSKPLKFDPHPTASSYSTMPPQGTNYKPDLYLPQPRLGPFQYEYPQPHNEKPKMILAKKIDKSEALQKSYYDPRTVARDVLIASGRHPSEKPLNLHVANLIGTFVELDSDVSTFDWDSIDPGGPPPPKIEYVDIPAAPPRFKLGERVKRVKAREPEPGAAEETRQGYPTSHAQAQPDASSSSAALQHPSSLSNRIHHDVDRKLTYRPDRTPQKSTPGNRKISIDIPVSSTQRSTPSLSQQVVDAKKPMESDTPRTKKRGRPPGSKNKYPSVASMKEQAKAAVTATATAIPTPVEATPEPVLHSYKCKWVRCHAELHNLETLKRHVLKKHTPPIAEVQQDNYVCWWKKCKYLEPDGDGNMAPTHTFKQRDDWAQHIEEDHIRAIADKYGDGPKATQTGKQGPPEFTLSRFLYQPQVGPVTRMHSHVDPQSVESARERYLSDTSGRVTTPFFTPDGNPDQPHDAMVLTKAYPQGPKTDKEKADVQAQNAFMKAHGNRHHDSRKTAEEVVRAMEARKAKIGPGIDRGGCTLINEARRSTFMQAPGISRIVDAEY